MWTHCHLFVSINFHRGPEFEQGSPSLSATMKWDTIYVRVSSCEVVANVLTCDIVVSEFDFQSCEYVYFRNSSTIILLQE